MFEKIGHAWVRRLKACVAATGVFFLNNDRETSQHCRSKTPRQKHIIQHVI